MVVYKGVDKSVVIKYTGTSNLITTAYGSGYGTDTGTNTGTGTDNCVSTVKTPLSGYMNQLNSIITTLAVTKRKQNALQRLQVLDQQLKLSRQQGLF